MLPDALAQAVPVHARAHVDFDQRRRTAFPVQAATLLAQQGQGVLGKNAAIPERAAVGGIPAAFFGKLG